MEKYKKIFTISFIILLILIVICIVVINILKNEKKDDELNNTISSQNANLKYVEEVTSVNETFNLGKYINQMIEESYKSGQYEYVDVPLIPDNLTKKAYYNGGMKNFYIDKAYKADVDENITLYFAKGYFVNENSKKIEKEKVELTAINDTENNTLRIYLYGDMYTDKIQYNNDISKTAISDTSGFNNTQENSRRKQVDEVLIEQNIYQNKKMDQTIEENELVSWYYKSYKINLAIEKEDKLELKAFYYEGNFDDGYKIFEADNVNILIKPSKIPMEYEVTI